MSILSMCACTCVFASHRHVKNIVSRVLAGLNVCLVLWWLRIFPDALSFVSVGSDYVDFINFISGESLVQALQTDV